MSATTEKLVERLQTLDEALKTAVGVDVETLQAERMLIIESLGKANKTLSEGKVLKG